MEGSQTKREKKLEYLPPLRYTPLVVQEHGSFRALDMLDAPRDAFGFPDASSTLRLIGSQLLYDDELESHLQARSANIHHFMHSRRRYVSRGRSSVHARSRESPFFKAQMKVPIHNLGHLIVREPKMASKNSMIQHTIELDAVKRLYRVGRAVLWLDEMSGHGTQTYRTAQDFFMKKGFRGDEYGAVFLPSHASFLDELDKFKDGIMGVLPDREGLSRMSLPDAVGMLAKIATSEVMISDEESTTIILQASRDEYEKAA